MCDGDPEVCGTLGSKQQSLPILEERTDKGSGPGTGLGGPALTGCMTLA